MHVAGHHTFEQLDELEKRERRARQRLRWRMVILAKRGKTTEQIVEAVGASRRTVQRVIERYNQQSVEGLEDRAGRGRKSKLKPEQVPRLKERLNAGPTQADGVASFTGTVIQSILEREFGVLYSLNGVYQWLHRHGYSWLVPRPCHENADPGAQEEFKKKRPS